MKYVHTWPDLERWYCIKASQVYIYIYIYAFSRRFIQATYIAFKLQFLHFYQLLLSLGIEPMILALLAPCSTSWATGKLED